MSQKERELCLHIYKMYHKRLNWYLWKWFSWLNEDDVYDIMQDTWIELNERISEVSEKDPIHQLNWLLVVCHSKAISYLRMNGRVVDMDDEQVNAAVDAKREISLEDEVMKKLMLEELLKELTEEERKILFMSEFGKSKKKRKQSNAMTCKLYRIKQKLRKKWKEGGWDE